MRTPKYNVNCRNTMGKGSRKHKSSTNRIIFPSTERGCLLLLNKGTKNRNISPEWLMNKCKIMFINFFTFKMLQKYSRCDSLSTIEVDSLKLLIYNLILAILCAMYIYFTLVNVIKRDASEVLKHFQYAPFSQ